MAKAKAKSIQKPSSERMTVELLVDGDEKQSIFKIRDVDENFVAYLTSKLADGCSEMVRQKDLWDVSEAVHDLCVVLGEAEKRVKGDFDGRNGDADRYFAEVVKESYRRKCELFGMVTNSVCSGRSFDDLEAVSDRLGVGTNGNDMPSLLGYPIDYDKWWVVHSIVIRISPTVRHGGENCTVPFFDGNRNRTKKSRLTVELLVDGKSEYSAIKIHDVDDNFMSYLGFDKNCDSIILSNEEQLCGVNAKFVTMFNVLTVIEHRHFRDFYKYGKEVCDDRGKISRRVSVEMSKMSRLITGSPCSRRTWSDLMSACDDSVNTFWYFMNSRMVDDWWCGGTFIEVRRTA